MPSVNKMDTPICDFVSNYASSDTLRMHMPGHKGSASLGVEHLDITEIQGADSLYEAEGIIAESEANASDIFGCKTLICWIWMLIGFTPKKQQAIFPVILQQKIWKITFGM